MVIPIFIILSRTGSKLCSVCTLLMSCLLLIPRLAAESFKLHEVYV